MLTKSEPTFAAKYNFWSKERLSFSIQPIRNWLYDKLIPENVRSVFEVGSGLGEFARYTAELRYMRYIGLEPHSCMRDALKDEGFDVRPGTISEFEMIEKVDLVYAAHVIEHFLDYDEVFEMIEKCRGFLKPKGRMLFLYPDIEKSAALFFRDYTHCYPTTKKRVEDILSDCGMRVVRSGYYSGPFTNPLIVWFIHKIFKFVPMPDSWRSRIQVCGYTEAMV